MTDSASILVVDDNAANRYLVRRVLSRAGFQVREATTGAEAMRLLAERPELVVLDINLPDLSGLEVCRRIKGDPATASTAVLQVSATFVEPEQRAQGLEGGADAFLVQPVEPAELVATIRALLRVRRAEEQARNSAAQWQTTFDAIADGVALTDPDGMVMRANQALHRVLGQRSLVGRPAREVLAPLGEGAVRLLDRGGGGRGAAEAEAGGRWYAVTVDRVPGTWGGSVVIVSDVTERRRVERERDALLAQEQEARRQLQSALSSREEALAVVAHDLKNPLNTIKLTQGYLASVLGPGATESVHKRLGAISRAADTMDRLITDLLDLARIESGRLALSRTRLDAATTLAEAQEQLAPLASAKGLTLAVHPPAGALAIDADPARLSQVFSNLIGNAVKFTSEGGRIEVSARPGDGGVIFTVADTGAGIDPEHLPHVFERYFQARQQGRSNIGLGLAIVRGVVEAHGGRIWVESRPGQGTAFHFTVPAAA